MKIMLTRGGQTLEVNDSYGRRMIEMGKARKAAALPAAEPKLKPSKEVKARKRVEAQEDEPERQD